MMESVLLLRTELRTCLSTPSKTPDRVMSLSHLRLTLSPPQPHPPHPPEPPDPPDPPDLWDLSLLLSSDFQSCRRTLIFSSRRWSYPTSAKLPYSLRLVRLPPPITTFQSFDFPELLVLLLAGEGTAGLFVLVFDYLSILVRRCTRFENSHMIGDPPPSPHRFVFSKECEMGHSQNVHNLGLTSPLILKGPVHNSSYALTIYKSMGSEAGNRRAVHISGTLSLPSSSPVERSVSSVSESHSSLLESPASTTTTKSFSQSKLSVLLLAGERTTGHCFPVLVSLVILVRRCTKLGLPHPVTSTVRKFPLPKMLCYVLTLSSFMQCVFKSSAFMALRAQILLQLSSMAEERIIDSNSIDFEALCKKLPIFIYDLNRLTYPSGFAVNLIPTHPNCSLDLLSSFYVGVSALACTAFNLCLLLQCNPYG